MVGLNTVLLLGSELLMRPESILSSRSTSSCGCSTLINLHFASPVSLYLRALGKIQMELRVSMDLVFNSAVLVWTVSIWTIGVVEVLLRVPMIQSRMVILHLRGTITWLHHGQYLGEPLAVLNTNNFVTQIKELTLAILSDGSLNGSLFQA